LNKANIVIEEGASIAPSVKIGPFCYIGKDVVIEDNVTLHAHVTLEGRVHIKENSQIFSHVKMGNKESRVEIASNVHIREFVEIASDGSGKVSIGENTMVMAYCNIAVNVMIGTNVILTNNVLLSNDVVCEENVIVGGLTMIAASCRIGKGVMIGGASSVHDSIPPFSLVEGNPGRVRGLNLIGLRRKYQDPQVTLAVKDVYKRAYKNGIDKEVAQKILQKNENEQSSYYAMFILDNF